MTIAAEREFAPIDGAHIHYEIAGSGAPFVMIHAGVADSRMWQHELDHFAKRYRVLRYDMRGYGRSEPVAGEFTHVADLRALLRHVRFDAPIVAMGCSMGGGIAMDLALRAPRYVRALVMVGSGPSGLALDVPTPALFDEVKRADAAGDLDRVCELETQIWFDGIGRRSDAVDPAMRRLAYEMNRNVLAHEAKKLGALVHDGEAGAATRLHEIEIPVLIVVGKHDIPYIHAAADYMLERLPHARRVVIDDAAHLPNLDQPDEFRRIVDAFLDAHARS